MSCAAGDGVFGPVIAEPLDVSLETGTSCEGEAGATGLFTAESLESLDADTPCDDGAEPCDVLPAHPVLRQAAIRTQISIKITACLCMISKPP
jgi:hypothetical protein